MSQDLVSWEILNYSFLDLLGDIGGLYYALFIIVKVLLSPVSAFIFQSSVLTNFFRFKKSGFNSNRPEKGDSSQLSSHIESEFKKAERFEAQNFVLVKLCYCMNRKAKNYRSMINKSQATLNKEMDL